ncbi:MAG TPA: hypothetical protein VE527_05040, partial [Reyranella sp.]|jgi:hypothetical protein|nr:hypothetical protein [Reyranella sp.]
MISSTAEAAVKAAQLSNVMQSSGYAGGSSHRLAGRSAGFSNLVDGKINGHPIFTMESLRLVA